MQTKRIFKPSDPLPPVNQVLKQVGDICTVVNTTDDPNKGLDYNDFSLNSLLSAGAIDLIKGHPKLGSNAFDDMDMANAVLSSDIDSIAFQNEDINLNKDNPQNNESTIENTTNSGEGSRATD